MPNAVRDALTASEQRLAAAVLAVNLALGGWFIAHADFSGILPNHCGARPGKVMPMEAVPMDDGTLENTAGTLAASQEPDQLPPDQTPGRVTGLVPLDTEAPRVADSTTH